MVKNLAKFIFLFSLNFQNLQASDNDPKDILTKLPKLIFSNFISFLDIKSIRSMHLSSKSLHEKILGLEEHFKGTHTILDPKQVKLLEICMEDFCKENEKILNFNEKNSTVRTSMSPFCFSAYLVEETNKNENLKIFMDEFIDTLLLDKKNIFVEWQSIMIRKKMLRPFFEKIIMKSEKQKWEQIFENELFTTEKYTETHHSYHVLPFAFFLDCGIPVNYAVKNSMYSYNATPLEVVAEKGLYSICLFLLKNGADVDLKMKEFDYITDGTCLYSAILGYIELLRQEKNCDEAVKTIGLLIDWGADKDHKLTFEQTIREFVKQHIQNTEILGYFEKEK